MSRRKLPPPRSGFRKKEPEAPQLHSALVRQARQTGQLNLSNRQLTEIPTDVWRVNIDTPESGQTVSLEDDGNRWWEQVDLTKLIVASNQLTSISEDIINLPALVVLDVHDNRLTSLPEALCHLMQLEHLNFSHNDITMLPPRVGHLENLVVLQCQHNSITEIPDGFFRGLPKLEKLDISHNKLQTLGGGIRYSVRLTVLNVANNQLMVLPHDIGDLSNLRCLDCTHNQIHTVPDELSRLEMLEQLYLRHNKLTHLPVLMCCVHLKELYLGNNCLQGLRKEHFETMPSVHILELRDNRIQLLPEEIVLLQNLERLDVANNELSNLPFVLGTLNSLKSLQVEGNPMKMIRRDIIMRGTMELKKYLRSRMDQDPDMQTLGSGSGSVLKPTGMSGVIGGLDNLIDANEIKYSRIFDFSEKKVSDLPPELWEILEGNEIEIVDLTKNNFTELPTRLMCTSRSLSQLKLGFNKLSRLDPCVGSFPKLQYLDLRNNQLTELPDTLKSLKALRELVLSCNRFTVIPRAVYTIENLEILMVNENQLEAIDASALKSLERLSTLDLTNNNIAQVPPELGLCQQLRTLKLEGNAFRQPRPAVLAKGTNALLEYLRDRIPT